MKICRITYSYTPYCFGGADIYTGKISQALANQGNKEVVITVNPTKGDSVENLGNIKIYRFYPFNISTFHNIGNKSVIKQGIWTLLDIYSYYSYLRIKDILNHEKPDIVHIHTPIDVTLSAVNAVKHLGLPLLYTLHDYFLLCRRFVLMHGFRTMCTDDNLSPLCKIYRKFTKKIVNTVDVVIAPSQFVLDMHTKNGFFNNSKKVVLPHGIELNCAEITNDINLAKNNDKKFNIFYMGNLRSHKGIHVLISAFKKIYNDNIGLHIVGSGACDNELKHLAGSDRRIVFYGQISNKEVQGFYDMADVVVVPSIWHDVRPNVILEAFRAKVPVIGSSIGGIPELIINNYNGFLFESGNIMQLKEILENIIKNPEGLREMGENARKSIEKYEMSKYISKLLNVYSEAIENKK